MKGTSTVDYEALLNKEFLIVALEKKIKELEEYNNKPMYLMIEGLLKVKNRFDNNQNYHGDAILNIISEVFKENNILIKALSGNSEIRIGGGNNPRTIIIDTKI